MVASAPAPQKERGVDSHGYTSCGRDGSGKVGGILLAWRFVVSTTARRSCHCLTECIQSGDDPSVSTVEEIIPPTMGAAMRLITSAAGAGAP